jgi:peptidoglycan hydrolase CwlO-like protein
VPNLLQIFTTRASKFTHPDGTLTREAIRMFDMLFDRVGGATSASMADLALSDDDDSGLEEFKHESGKTLDGLLMAPLPTVAEFTDQLYPLHQEHSEIQHLQSEVGELRATVAELQKQIQGLQEGTTI